MDGTGAPAYIGLRESAYLKEPLLPNLSLNRLADFLLYLFSVLAIGFLLRANIKTSKDFFQAGRALPGVDLRAGVYCRRAWARKR